LARSKGSIAVDDHHENAGVLWQTFWGRRGFSTPTDSNFDFPYIFSRGITHDKIDKLVQELPIDRAPRPNVFLAF
jgi:hypothetical protein